MKYLDGEIITEGIAAQLFESDSSIRQFLSGLDSDKQRRFCELAHELVYVGYISYEERSIPTSVAFDKERQAERRLSHEAAIYTIGIRDHSRLMEEGEI